MEPLIAKANPGTTGCGGLIRDESGSWIGAFAFNIGICSTFMAELWGVLKGLEVAWNKGIKESRSLFLNQIHLQLSTC